MLGAVGQAGARSIQWDVAPVEVTLIVSSIMICAGCRNVTKYRMLVNLDALARRWVCSASTKTLVAASERMIATAVIVSAASPHLAHKWVIDWTLKPATSVSTAFPAGEVELWKAVGAVVTFQAISVVTLYPRTLGMLRRLMLDLSNLQDTVGLH